MNRIKRRIQQAERRGVHLVNRGADGWRGWYVTQTDKFDVYVDSEAPWAPREIALTKRQAVALAYGIAVSKKTKLTFEVVDA